MLIIRSAARRYSLSTFSPCFLLERDDLAIDSTDAFIIRISKTKRQAFIGFLSFEGSSKPFQERPYEITHSDNG